MKTCFLGKLAICAIGKKIWRSPGNVFKKGRKVSFPRKIQLHPRNDFIRRGKVSERGRDQGKEWSKLQGRCSCEVIFRTRKAQKWSSHNANDTNVLANNYNTNVLDNINVSELPSAMGQLNTMIGQIKYWKNMQATQWTDSQFQFFSIFVHMYNIYIMIEI